MLALWVFVEIVIFSAGALGQELVGLSEISKYRVEGATYLGCFDERCQTEGTYLGFKNSTYLTPTSCVVLCTHAGFVFASIHGSVCTCSRHFNCSHLSALANNMCGRPCSGNTAVFCGGISKIAVYKVKLQLNTSPYCQGAPITRAPENHYKANECVYYIAAAAATCVSLVIVVTFFVCIRCSSDTQSVDV
ncbi:uncharacterized protein [Diadema antillarum]|uniref:uncharacterized protein n=1 Tax=Diadema antillarum TaxID=105358 RepID=UPI003A8A8736